MFKVAINAGHGINTAGKRCLKSIDPKETREWTLNSRICSKVEEKMKAYTGYELLRIDDKTGKTDYAISTRAKKANDFGADIYIAVHHNAGIKGGSGGGVVSYVYLKVDETTKKLQKLLYDKIIAKTSLKGNRSNPLPSADFGEVRETKMPAVLLECGFMDSTTDTPIILTDAYADKVAEAITEAVAEFGKLQKKQITPAPAPAPAPAPEKKLYYVQVGAYSAKENAEKMVKNLQKAGFPAIIKQ